MQIATTADNLVKMPITKINLALAGAGELIDFALKSKPKAFGVPSPTLGKNISPIYALLTGNFHVFRLLLFN